MQFISLHWDICCIEISACWRLQIHFLVSFEEFCKVLLSDIKVMFL